MTYSDPDFLGVIFQRDGLLANWNARSPSRLEILLSWSERVSFNGTFIAILTPLHEEATLKSLGNRLKMENRIHLHHENLEFQFQNCPLEGVSV